MATSDKPKKFQFEAIHITVALIVLLAIIISVVTYIIQRKQQNTATSYQTSYNTKLVNDTSSPNLPSVKAYQEQINNTLQASPPILQVDNPTDQQTNAYDILAADEQLAELTQSPEGATYRMQVMQSYALPANQANGDAAACASDTCYRLDIYNFTNNQTVVAVIDLSAGQVLQLQATKTQPTLPDSLTKLAEDITNNNPAVKASLGDAFHDAVISSGMKTSLQQTVCENSKHLCVAPTYVLPKDKSALWAIVDLTDLKVVGTAWSEWTGDQPPPLTEGQLASNTVQNNICGKVLSDQRGDWQFDYTLTGSDGLEIRNVRYKGQQVIDSAKNPDWHVSYSGKDGFGYSDATGCPSFSTAAVVPSQLPSISVGQNGQVVLQVDFRSRQWPLPCNYYYQQRYEMNTDGSFRPVVASLGRGCGNDGTYRPVTRIQLPATVSDIKRNNKTLNNETWWQPTGCAENSSCSALSFNQNGTIYDVVPANGQFQDGGRGDKPYIYLSSVDSKKLEGQDDILTMGSCCNTDYHQGPEVFVNSEPLAGKPVALWYVAQLKNDDTPGGEYCWASSDIANGRYETHSYPCPSGPLLKPRGN